MAAYFCFMRFTHSCVVWVYSVYFTTPRREMAAAAGVEWDCNGTPQVDMARSRGADRARAVVTRGVVHHLIDALCCVVFVTGFAVSAQGLGPDNHVSTRFDNIQALSHVLHHGVGRTSFSQALGHSGGGGLGELLAVATEVALGLSGGGDRGLQGDGDVDAGPGLDQTGQLVSDGDAIAAGGADQVAEDAVIAVDGIGVEGGDEHPEFLQQGQVALGRVRVAGAHVDPRAADQSVEARVEDSVQQSDGAVLGGAEEVVVAFK